jgi:hypothetical protein
MKFQTTLLILSFSLVFFVYCSKNTVELTSYQEEFIYSNSFETSEDTIGWKGYGDFSFFSESCPYGGSQSLLVSGGCYSPHAYFILPPLTESSDIILRFWSKCLYGSSRVNLYVLNGSYPLYGIEISFSDTLWNQYSDTLFYQSDYDFQLELSSGGIVPGGMLIDKIEIVKVQ